MMEWTKYTRCPRCWMVGKSCICDAENYRVRPSTVSPERVENARWN